MGQKLSNPTLTHYKWINLSRHILFY